MFCGSMLGMGRHEKHVQMGTPEGFLTVCPVCTPVLYAKYAATHKKEQ